VTKFNQKEYTEYWRNLHLEKNDELATICFPDKPAYFNKFFDNIQKFAINNFINRYKIDLAEKKLLDVGCGRGRWLSFFMNKHNACVSGIDLSGDAVTSCRKKGFNTLQASAVKIPFSDNAFDIVTSITVLLHIPYEDKRDVVHEIARVLKSGGKVIMIDSTWKNDPSSHVYALSFSELERLFKTCSLKLIYNAGHYFNFFRRSIPDRVPFKNHISIYLDYPLEYILMKYYSGKKSKKALQHLMVFEKM